MTGARSAPAAAPVGIVAGRGAYPVALCRAIAARGIAVAVACLAGQAEPGAFAAAAAVRTVPLGALRELAGFFLANGVDTAFLAGGVGRKGALRCARPDVWCAALLPLALLGPDDRLLRAVADRLAALGVRVGDPRPFLGDLVAPAGRIAGPEIDPGALADLRVAVDAARRAGAAGRGQAAVAFRGASAGLEDRRGTDALLARAPGPGAVLAKVAAPGQDERFDLPAIGPSTIRIARMVRLAAIGVEGGRALVLDRPRVAALCGEHGIPLVGI